MEYEYQKGEQVMYEGVAWIVKEVLPDGNLSLQSVEQVERECGCCMMTAYITVDPNIPEFKYAEN